MLSATDREAYTQALAYHTNQVSFLWQLLYSGRAEERRRINSPWAVKPAPVEPDTDKSAMLMHD